MPFFISDEPFKHFKRESAEFLETVQDVFDVSFPDVGYKLNLRDDLVEKVYFRLNSNFWDSLLN